jgi:hypothetical protein
LTGALPRLRSMPARAVFAAHRIPLGLLLLSRQQLTVEQLQRALAMQRSAGHGRIGEWLQHLGFATATQVTGALARQWACPLLRDSAIPEWKSLPDIPLRLLEYFHVIPVSYIESTATLHLAFCEGIDYGLLYAIEQMLGCHTEACLATPVWLEKHLSCPRLRGSSESESEVVFDHTSDPLEAVRIIRSYAVRLGSSEIRMVACGRYTWVRLEERSRAAVNLLLGSVDHSTEAHALSSLSATLSSDILSTLSCSSLPQTASTA